MNNRNVFDPRDYKVAELGPKASATKRHDKVPTEFGFELDVKTDILYRLIMPKLAELMSAELAQSGEENGFELFLQLSRKIDPPRVDVAFDLKAEIECLG